MVVFLLGLLLLRLLLRPLRASPMPCRHCVNFGGFHLIDHVLRCGLSVTLTSEALKRLGCAI
jgi:hypothetical protein